MTKYLLLYIIVSFTDGQSLSKIQYSLFLFSLSSLFPWYSLALFARLTSQIFGNLDLIQCAQIGLSSICLLQLPLIATEVCFFGQFYQDLFCNFIVIYFVILTDVLLLLNKKGSIGYNGIRKELTSIFLVFKIFTRFLFLLILTFLIIYFLNLILMFYFLS